MSQRSQPSSASKLCLVMVSTFLTTCSTARHPAAPEAVVSVPRAETAPVLDSPQVAGRGGEVERKDTSPNVAAAGSDGGRGVEPDAGAKAPTMSPLWNTHFALRNETARPIWHGGSSGCDDRWLRVGMAQPPQPSAAELSASAQALDQIGCLCTCEDLSEAEVCTRSKCPEGVTCTAALWSAPIAPGQALEGDVATFTTKLDVGRKCMATVGYPSGTELIATFCFTYSEYGPEVCRDVRFRAGDASVEYVVSTADEDAGI
jgi:hypothetical protein